MMASSVMPLLPRLVASSVAIANHAGQVIRDVLKTGDLKIVQKEHVNDLQTEADRAAQRCIVGSLTKMFPGITIIGEEEESTGSVQLTDENTIKPVTFKCPEHLAALKEEQVVVWVDPVDGTSEFTQGLLDHVTVLIGIAAHGKTIAGVIHQPYYNYQKQGAPLGRTVWGVPGGGYDGLTVTPPPTTGCVVTTTRSHSNATIDEAVSACQPASVLRVGGAGHKVLMVLNGEAHAYVFASPGCKKWDTCAPQAVLEAAGGRLTNIMGEDLQYHKEVATRNSEGVLATAPGENHQEYVTKIPATVHKTLKR